MILETSLQYTPKRPKTKTKISGNNENRLHAQELEQQWKNLMNFVTYKFQPKSLIIPRKTVKNLIQHAKLIFITMFSFNLITKFVHPHTLSLSLSQPKSNPQMFCHDGIHFSFYVNGFLTSFLTNLFSYCLVFRNSLRGDHHDYFNCHRCRSHFHSATDTHKTIPQH